jgi:adenylate kinase
MEGGRNCRPIMPPAANTPELEVKDGQLIFGASWRALEGEFGRSRMRFPKELILLGGAPGAGKGTNTDFVRKVRGIEAPPIVVSQLLDTPEARAVKARGGMVGDREVVGILLRKLLEPEQQNGALLDGFPRTKVRVECIKLFFNEMIALRREFSGAPGVIHFKTHLPHHGVVRRRGGKRGAPTQARTAGRRPQRGGHSLGRGRTLGGTGDGLQRGAGAQPLPHLQGANLRRAGFPQADFPLPVHQRPGTYPEVQVNMLRELEYQSSLELDPRTFDRLRGLPLASEIVRYARQDLVRRLDGYEVEQPETFGRVLEFIEGKMMPIVVRHAVSGIASINSEDPLFEDPAALAMLIDVFSERGFHATVDITRIGVPLRIDLKTGEIYSQEKKSFSTALTRAKL